MEAKVYAVYKGEECEAVGTVAELAQRLGLKESTIRFMASPAHHRRDKGKRRVVVKLDD